MKLRRTALRVAAVGIATASLLGVIIAPASADCRGGGHYCYHSAGR